MLIKNLKQLLLISLFMITSASCFGFVQVRTIQEIKPFVGSIVAYQALCKPLMDRKYSYAALDKDCPRCPLIAYGYIPDRLYRSQEGLFYTLERCLKVGSGFVPQDIVVSDDLLRRVNIFYIRHARSDEKQKIQELLLNNKVTFDYLGLSEKGIQELLYALSKKSSSFD